MACSISITSVSGNGSPTTTSVTVEGTLSGDCAPIIFDPASAFDVIVNADCGGGGVTAQALSSGGNWSVTIPMTCDCGGDIKVTARCATNPDCSTSFGGLLPCNEPQPGQCPSIQLTGLSIGDCGPGGTTPVTVSALVTPNGFCTCELRAGATLLDGPTSGTSPFTLSGSGSFSGAVNLQVAVLSPTGCAGFGLPLSLPTCPSCPDIEFDYEIGACDEGGNRLITVTAELTSMSQFSAELHQPLGTIIATTGGLVGPGTVPLSFLGLYPGATSQDFFVVVTSPATCGDSQFTVDVPGCLCPDVSFTTQFGDCTNGQRELTLTVTLSTPASAELHGPSGLLGSVNPGTTLAHTGTYPSGSSQSFTVDVIDPSACESKAISVDVPKCGNGNGTGWCGALLPLVGLMVCVATALTVLVLAIQICPSLASVPVSNFLWGVIAGLWIAVGLLIAGWYALCAFNICDCPGNCDWLALAWMAPLTATIVALYLAGCCAGSLWWLLILILAAAYVAAFTAWLLACSPSKCQVVDLMLVVFVSIVGVVFAYMGSVPIVSMCVISWISTAVATISAALAVLAAACHASGP